jgi:hypothetical protein
MSYKLRAFDQHLPAFLKVLLVDARISGMQDRSQEGRRNFARQTFAFLDGGMQCLRTLTFMAVGNILLPTEIGALYSNFGLDDQGDVKRLNKHELLTPRLLFTSRLLARYQGISAQIDTSQSDWGELRKAQKLRNRVTHPRLPADLDISDDEFETLEAALSWFDRHLGKTFAEAAIALNQPTLADDVVQAMLNEG